MAEFMGRIPSDVLSYLGAEIKNYKINSAGVPVASSDLTAGDVVLCLPPLAAGAGRGQVPVCLGCLTVTGKVDPNSKRAIYNQEMAEQMFGSAATPKDGDDGDVLGACSHCGWPVHMDCPACQESIEHKEECGIFCTNKIAWEGKEFKEKTRKLDGIGPLRLLLKINKNEKLKHVLKYETKNKERGKRNEELYPGGDREIINFIREDCKIKDFSESEIETAIGLFEMYSEHLECGAKSVHEDTPQLSHSCNPNTYNISLSNQGVVYRASRPIQEGEIITTCKATLDLCNLFRRRELAQHHFIDCQCERCKDGTEFGTGFGGINCSSCNKGTVCSTDSSKESAEWKCNQCGNKKPGKDCIAILDSLKQKLDATVANSKAKFIPLIADGFENMLKGLGEWSQVGSNNQILLEIMKQLTFTYQYHRDYFRPDQDMLKLKKHYCMEILKLYNKLFPGYSYIRVSIDYEHIVAAQALIEEMKWDGEERAVVDVVIRDVYELCKQPTDMLSMEEDRSLREAIGKLCVMAVEAKEQEKKRVYMRHGQFDYDEDDE